MKNKETIHNSQENGFTLIEVLIAMVVFAVGVMAVAQMQSHAQAANTRAFHQTEATMYASNQIETFISMDYADSSLPHETDTTGSPVYLDPDDKYGLTWTVDENAIMGQKAIVLTVTWKGLDGKIKWLVFDIVKPQGS